MNDSSEYFNSIDRFNLDSTIHSNAANNTIGDDDDLANITGVNEGIHVGFPAAVTAPTANTATVNSTNNRVNATTASAAAPTLAATAFDPVPAVLRASDSAVATNAVAVAIETTAANTVTAAIATATIATPATSTAATTVIATATADSVAAPQATAAMPSADASTSGLNNPPILNNPSADNTCRLKVVSKNRLRTRRESIESALKSFYVTPFHNGQTVEDITEYLREVMNTNNSRINCVKLVPRNKNIEECTFVSFKVSVSDDLASMISDPFYWPEGVEVREFRPKNDNVQISVQPT